MIYEVSKNKVVEIFGAISGEENIIKGAVFCHSAADSVTDWLDRRKSLADADYRICYAAACIANYRFVLNEVGASADVKAGDITVREHKDERVKNAEILMKDALLDIEPLLRSKRFAFIKTEG